MVFPIDLHKLVSRNRLHIFLLELNHWIIYILGDCYHISAESNFPADELRISLLIWYMDIVGLFIPMRFHNHKAFGQHIRTIDAFVSFEDRKIHTWDEMIKRTWYFISNLAFWYIWYLRLEQSDCNLFISIDAKMRS